uniref:Uncharacterized protein n=1 Tax=Aegilops tauschii TaxID=37682 RepID=N1QV40_AEGTA
MAINMCVTFPNFNVQVQLDNFELFLYYISDDCGNPTHSEAIWEDNIELSVERFLKAHWSEGKGIPSN